MICGWLAHPAPGLPPDPWRPRPFCGGKRRVHGNVCATTVRTQSLAEMAKQFCRWDPEMKIINRLFLSQGNTIILGLTLGDVIAALREAVPKLRISFLCLCNLETRFW